MNESLRDDEEEAKTNVFNIYSESLNSGLCIVKRRRIASVIVGFLTSPSGPKS